MDTRTLWSALSEKITEYLTSSSSRWTYADWMFSSKPGVFGLVPGFANPTGVALIIILTLMVVCSMSFVRRSGYFQVNTHF